MRVVWFALWCLVPALAHADDASYWRRLTTPEVARADELVQQARALLVPTSGPAAWFGLDAPQRTAAIDSAIARAERAVLLVPTHCAARLVYAKALLARGRHDTALAQLDALRAIDASFEEAEVSFELGLVHTHRSEYAQAAREYRHALAMRVDDEADPLLGNLAEVTMLAGDLDEARALYEQAARSSDGTARVLALWGQAVALDRLGDPRAALARAGQALREDRAPFTALHQSTVFFVPTYEAAYYEGLGQLAVAEQERADAPLRSRVNEGVRWLFAPRPASSLLAFERALAELEPNVPEASAWTRRLQDRPRITAPGRKRAEDAPNEAGPRVVLALLRAAASFAAYDAEAHGVGPFVADARAHLVQLRAWLFQTR